LEETGKRSEAQEIFSALTQKTDYYAILSAYRLNQSYRAVHNPVPVTTQDIKALQQQQDIKSVAEWFALGRKDEALKQWWSMVKHFTPQQIMAAAKLAQHWQQHKLAALTVAKAEYWQDLELRFPIAFTQEINTYASQFGLDPAVVFGLIRQESVFDELAGSSVGARGLMQIMPGTGRQIAKQLQEPWSSDASLYEPDTNIRYGTFYLSQLVNKFNGQVALAAAGYNAGPGRINKWRPARAMPMDVWIETIPFNETRQYVRMVLANALFYQQRINGSGLKMSDFMTDVQPAG
jgi:soluble lytic murein transglycosylase